jgi:hypothetical protein
MTERGAPDHRHCSRCGAELRWRAAPYRWDGTCPDCYQYDVVIWDDNMDDELARSDHARAVMVRLLPKGVAGPREYRSVL